MRIYRPTYIYRPTGDRRVQKVWWAQFYVYGKEFRFSTGERDRQVAQRVALDLMEDVKGQMDGLVRPGAKHLRKTLSQHVEDWEIELRGRGSQERHVKDRTVLNVRPVADDDPVDITSCHRMKPDRDIVAELHVADHPGRRRQEDVPTELGFDPAI